jgi:ATP-binding cassette, subfamily B, heavy metal transporter
MTVKNKKTDEKVDFKKNLRHYFKIARPYRPVFLILILFASIIAAAHVIEKFLFKIIIDRGTEYLALDIDRAFFISILVGIAAAYGLILVMKVIIHWAQVRMINRLDGNMMFDVKRKFFNHLVHLSHNFHTTHKTGSMIARMNRGNRGVEGITDFFIFNLIPLFLEITFVGIAVLYFDFYSAIVIVLTATAFISFGLYISHKQQRPQHLANKAEDVEKGNMADIFTNIDSVKYFGKERAVKKRFEGLITDTKNKLIRFWDYQTWFSAGQSLILGIGTFFLLFFPILRLIEGDITIGTVAFIYTVYFNLMGPLFGFVHGIRRFFVALGDVNELFEYDAIKNEIQDKPGAKSLKVRKGQVEFSDVGFTYPGKKNSAVKDFNLSVKPGEKIALVGHSGCGKTTLVKLLYRFYDVQKGGIKIDGTDIRDVRQESLRSELSIVPQEPILFDDTIYNNIRFSSPSATRKEIMKAIKFAQLDRFISELPNKEDTIVGERGVKLSGGEKQRVSIARAILANRKILVLDEATSALDSHTENEIQKDLEKLMEGRTSIIIAHRLSTIMKADRIVVMDRGKIAQIGNHRDLIGKPGIYQNLWGLQKGGYIN